MQNVESTIDRVSKEFFPEPKTGIPAAGTYFAALLVSIVIVLPQFTASGDRRLFWLFLAALMGLLLVRMWTVAAMFLLLQIQLGINERPRVIAELASNEIVFGTGVLVMVIAGCRLATLVAPMVAPDSTIFGLIRTAWRRVVADSEEDANAVMPTRRGVSFSVSEGLTGLARAIGAVAVAAFVLSLVPLDPSTRSDVLLFEWAVRPITLGIGLIVVYQLVNAFLGILAWQRLSRAEARVYLRSDLVEWPHRDIRGVVRRQVNQRRDRRRS